MNRKYYDCFSIDQMKYLRENGVEPTRARIHHESKNTIWVFIRNEKLDALLTKWSARGKRKNDLIAV